MKFYRVVTNNVIYDFLGKTENILCRNDNVENMCIRMNYEMYVC